MGILGKKNFDNQVRVEDVTPDNYMAFSSPFLKTPQGNLSLPQVWDRYETRGYIPFGEDNLFPQYLDQMYFSSPLHGSIVDFKVNATVGGGYEVEGFEKLNARQKVEYYTFVQKLNLDKLLKQICKTEVVHERLYFLATIKDGNCKKIEFVSSSKVRTNKDKSIYTVCDDWTYNNNLKRYKPYDKTCKNGTYILCFEEHSLGQDIYSLPQYTSAMNYAFLSGEMSYLAKSNIQNSVFPSFAIKFPKKPQSDEEMMQIKNTVNKMKGAENAGKVVAFFANNQDQLPIIDPVPVNNNDNLFREASELITEQICFSHTIDPILLGVRTTGSLGNGSDIKQAYVIFEKNVIIPLRKRMEEIVNKLFSVAGLDCKIEITNYQIINETITEVEDNEVVKGLMALPDDLRAKVIENMSADEIRQMAGLPSIETSAPSPSGATSTGGVDETQLNDALKGLTAKDNMDMMRIVRDFNKGKLPEALARTRLGAYGISQEVITEILSA